MLGQSDSSARESTTLYGSSYSSNDNLTLSKGKKSSLEDTSETSHLGSGTPTSYNPTSSDILKVCCDEDELLLTAASSSDMDDASYLTRVELIQYTIAIVVNLISLSQAVLFMILQTTSLTIYYYSLPGANDANKIGMSPLPYSFMIWYLIMVAYFFVSFGVVYAATCHLKLTRSVVSPASCWLLALSYIFITVWSFCFDRQSAAAATIFILLSAIPASIATIKIGDVIIKESGRFSMLGRGWYILFVIYLNLTAAYTTWVLCFFCINVAVMLQYVGGTLASFVDSITTGMILFIACTYLATLVSGDNKISEVIQYRFLLSPGIVMLWFDLACTIGDREFSAGVLTFSIIVCIVTSSCLLVQAYRWGRILTGKRHKNEASLEDIL